MADMEFKEYECQQCKNRFIDDVIKAPDDNPDIECPMCGSKDNENCGSIGLLDYFVRTMGAGGG